MSHKEAQKVIICPECGAKMNHHAVKIDYSLDEGAPQEIYTCPHCAHIELRRAEES